MQMVPNRINRVFNYDFDAHFTSKFYDAYFPFAHPFHTAAARTIKIFNMLKEELCNYEIFTKFPRDAAGERQLRTWGRDANAWPYIIDPKDFVTANGELSTDEIRRILSPFIKTPLSDIKARAFGSLILDKPNLLAECELKQLIDKDRLPRTYIDKAIEKIKPLHHDKDIIIRFWITSIKGEETPSMIHLSPGKSAFFSPDLIETMEIEDRKFT